MVNKKFIFLSILIIFLNFISAVTLNEGVTIETASGKSMTLSFDVNVTSLTIESDYIYLEGISYSRSGVQYACNLNHSASTIDSSTFCISDTSTDTTITVSSGGGSSSSPSSSTLEEGYTANFRKNFKLNFGEQTMTVTNLQEGTVTIEIAGSSYEISEDETVKIDTNKDGYYDVQVSAGSVNDVYATLTVKTIYEEVPAEEQESIVGNIVGTIEDTVKDKWIWIMIGIAGLVLLIFVGIKVLKKK